MLSDRSYNKKGFTLIEIILVIAIIGVLASLFVGNIFSSLARGRDSRRKQDLRSISQALELYYNDNNKYPDSLPAGGAVFTHPNDPDTIYLQKIPNDPSSSNSYCYETESGSGTWYKIMTNLENAQDSEVVSPLVWCGGDEFNFGIASTNITL